MFDNLTFDEKFALVSALINITHADDDLAEQEVDYFQSIREEKGFEDFDRFLELYEEKINSHDDYLELMKGVLVQETQELILTECLGAMDVDDEHHESEVEAIKEMCALWDKDVDEVLNRLK